ncbi:MAG TPA: TatD family hydrolase [Rectinemataceae bacterium]|nr:TatD family hydrolase [Rectinemataceae bacterium]
MSRPETGGDELPAAVSAPLTDCHAHLDHVAARLGAAALRSVLSAYAAAWGAAAPADRKEKCPVILDIGTEPGDLAPRVGRYGAYPFLRFSAGLWPGKMALERPGEALAALEKDAASAECSALGECGLDYHHMEASSKLQIALFEAQVDMAVRLGLPLIVHSREAFPDTFSVVSKAAAKIPVVIHCFGYGVPEAEKFLESGCMLSFAGNITYKNSDSLCRALAIVPSENLLVETDSPYMNPMPRRGKPTTPLDIVRTVEAAAALKNMTIPEFSAIVQANAIRIFSGRSGRT